jgi:gliding-associated putative ABC transporter substrate-binding component GldG
MKRRSKHGAQAITYLVLLLGIFLVLNLISAQVFSRLDLTEGKIYTLSDGSRELVANLEDPLTVKVFFSENLPAPYNANARYLRDLLDDYKTYSHGMFHYEFMDPSSEEELEKQARDFQIPPVQVNTVEKDQLQVKKVYMGLVFLYRDKHETIPVVQTTTGLEYEISSTIKYLTSAQRTKVGILKGLGAPDPYQEMNNLRSLLEKNYEITTVDLTGNKMVPEDVDVLMVAGVTQDFDDWSKFAIDQFIMRGGRAAFLLNKVSADLQTQMARKAPLKIDDWTKNYGFKINDDLVMDVRCGMVQMQQRMGFFTISNAVNYPFFPLVTSFNPKNDIVKDLENLILFFPSSIDTSYANEDSLDLEPLFLSSEKSKVQTGRFDINPPEKINPAEYNGGPYVLGITVEGEFPSFFAGKEIPQGDAGAEPPENTEIIPVSAPTRLVAIGDGHLVQDTFLNDPSNLAFLLNMVDWLAGEEDLIGLRTREVTNRPIAEVSAGVKTGVKYANIFIPPIVVILIGIIRWQIRRRRKNLEF